MDDLVGNLIPIHCARSGQHFRRHRRCYSPTDTNCKVTLLHSNDILHQNDLRPDTAFGCVVNTNSDDVSVRVEHFYGVIVI